MLTGDNDMPDRAVISVRDFDREIGTFSINTDVITSANFNDLTSDVNALRLALQAMILGEVLQTQITKVSKHSAAETTDPQAQRETKWQVLFRDTAAYLDPPGNTVPNPGYLREFVAEIPCANLDLLPAAGSGQVEGLRYLDLTGTEAAAFVTAFEAVARSPTGGAVEVIAIRQVGRNT